MPDLLIELFSEEIPAGMQARAAENLRRLVTDGLVEAGLTYAGAGAFATPRRLALSVEGLSAASADHREERRGPKVGAPDKAVEGFCRGAGVDRAALEERDTGKGIFYFAVVETSGRPAEEIVAEVLDHAIRHFPWPKSMRWGSGSLRWVRPLHSILCILSDEEGARVVPMEVDGIVAGDRTRGHRFMAPHAFSVSSLEDYEVKLKAAKVILRPEERAEAIWQAATNAAFAAGLEVVEDRGLLAEVAGLVEWPVVLLGEIDADFLDLPPEVLTTSMKTHQKFFSVRDPKSGRIERFVTVANIETEDHGATILAGNRKVLAARLADAKFFWENDLRVAKAGMGPWLDQLANVTFHAKLGSQAERVARIAALAREIAPSVGADPDLAEQAAQVCKADLNSEMVFEFPELQGLMGRYYSEAAGHSPEVAAACEEHYAPLGPSDAVPTASVSVAVALADKLDTLTGFWAIDEKPTGSKDPYALRRASLGVTRTLIGSKLRVPLSALLSKALLEVLVSWADQGALYADVPTGKDYPSGSSQTLTKKIGDRIDLQAHLDAGRTLFLNFGELRTRRTLSADLPEGSFVLADGPPIKLALVAFFHDRLKVHLRDEGIPHDVIDSVLAMPGSDDLTLVVKRAEALAAFLKTEDGENLVQGFKRANNILTQAEEADGVEYSYGADPRFAEGPEETALFAALDAAEAQIKPAMEAEDFAAAMTAMAALRAPIDAFFEAVQVNAENSVLRRNRLNLLSRIRTICLDVADLTKLEG